MKTQRNATLDVAKGLSLLSLPAIHSTLFFSLSTVHFSTFGEILAFIAENAAPTFMLTMGITITMGRKKTTRQILYRSFKLLLLGYLLNFLKFILPQLWNGIPVSFFTENGLNKDLNRVLVLLRVGDILQLAAIGYLITALMYRLRKFYLWAVLAMLIVMGVSPLVWQIQVDGHLSKFFIGFLNGRPPANFFPAFPWMAYPLAGLIVGNFIKKLSEKRAYRLITLSGFLLTILGLLFSRFEPLNWESDFYRLGPSGTSFHLGLAMVFLSLCRLFFKIRQLPRFFRLLTTLSKNVTVVYMIQWILVCWLLPLFGYHQINISATFIAVTLATTLTVSFTYFYVYLTNRNSKKTAMRGVPVQNQNTST